MSVLNECIVLTVSAEPVTAVEVPERKLSSYYVQTVPCLSYPNPEVTENACLYQSVRYGYVSH